MRQARPAAPGKTRIADTGPRERSGQVERPRVAPHVGHPSCWWLAASCALHGLLIAAFVWVSPAPPISLSDPIEIAVVTTLVDPPSEAAIHQPAGGPASAQPDPTPPETPPPDAHSSEPAEQASSTVPNPAQSDQPRVEAGSPLPRALESLPPDAQIAPPLEPKPSLTPDTALLPPIDTPPASISAPSPLPLAPRSAAKPVRLPRAPSQTSPPRAEASVPAASNADRTAEPAADSAPKAADISPRWRLDLAAWLHARKTYPPEARARGDQGGAAVRFTVTRDGQVIAVDLVRGSGSAVLDQAVRAMLEGARVPAFPPDMAHERITVTVQINYSLDR